MPSSIRDSYEENDDNDDDDYEQSLVSSLFTNVANLNYVPVTNIKEISESILSSSPSSSESSSSSPLLPSLPINNTNTISSNDRVSNRKKKFAKKKKDLDKNTFLSRTSIPSSSSSSSSSSLLSSPLDGGKDECGCPKRRKVKDSWNGGVTPSTDLNDVSQWNGGVTRIDQNIRRENIDDDDNNDKHRRRQNDHTIVDNDVRNGGNHVVDNDISKSNGGSGSGGLRRIDENTMNKLLDKVPDEVVDDLLKRRLPKLSKRRIVYDKPMPRILKNIILDLGLLDIANGTTRAEIFIGYCRSKNYSYNTVLRYYRILARLFETDGDANDANSTLPDPSAFTGKIHTRIFTPEDFVRLNAYVNERWCEYNAPLILAMGTGLRTMEILQFSAYTLYQLKERQTYVNIKRKQTVMGSEPIYWRPVYNTRLNLLIDKLIELYKPRYRAFFEHSIDTPLFTVTERTLVNRIRLAYAMACGKNPPHGFGIHSCRYALASLMSRVNGGNVAAVQAFLQHASLETTKKYLRHDFTHTREKFDFITDPSFSNVKRNLTKGSNEASKERRDDDNDDYHRENNEGHDYDKRYDPPSRLKSPSFLSSARDLNEKK